MKFNFWLVVLLALAPVFILFAGLGAAGGFESPAGWEILGMLAVAAVWVGHLATRRADEDAATSGAQAEPLIDSATPSSPNGAALAADYASSPSRPHDVDAAAAGYSNQQEVVTLLNQLLEAERAGAQGARDMSALADSAQTRTMLSAVAKDEARFCAMLFGHIKRLGETPSHLTGAFHAKLAALPALDDRLALLNRGQGWVVHKLSEAVPKIADGPLRADLQEMLTVHQDNIDRCTQLIEVADSRS